MIALKKWFRGKGAGDDGLTVDDLIALERLDEAESRLRSHLMLDRRDLHGRLKLADLLMKKGRRADALDEYFAVADGHARDGFYDKANALLAKVGRLLPNDEKVRVKREALARVKNLERRRDLVIDGLLESRDGSDERAGSSAFELKLLWRDLAASNLIERLSEDQLKRLFGAMRMYHFAEGDLLAEAGEERAELFLVAQGEIAAQARLAGGKGTDIRSFGPGSILGDRALLEHQPWPADYRAKKASSVLRLTRDALERALVGESDPKAFLDALREQRRDHEVADALSNLRENE